MKGCPIGSFKTHNIDTSDQMENPMKLQLQQR